LEKKQEELKAAITDLRKEINQRQHEIKSLKEDVETNVRRNEAEAKRLESCFEQIESLKVFIIVICFLI
jgi:peptidoglycan hydrolase CwlO-like protein